MYTYPPPQNLAYPARVLFDEGPLSRSDPSLGQSESWPDRGPGSVDEAGDDGGAPGGAAPYVIGRARLALSAARGGYVIPASKGCVAHTPGASRRSTPLAQVARGTSKPRTHGAARARTYAVIPGRRQRVRAAAHWRRTRNLDVRGTDSKLLDSGFAP